MLKKTQIKSSANIFLKLLGAFFIFWNSWKLRYYCFESKTKKRQLTFGLIRQLCQSRKRLNNIAHFLSKNDLKIDGSIVYHEDLLLFSFYDIVNWRWSCVHKKFEYLKTSLCNQGNYGWNSEYFQIFLNTPKLHLKMNLQVNQTWK